jgi:transposase-like protein
MEIMSLATVAGKFSDEGAAWDYVEELRWHGTPECAHCRSTDVVFIPPRGEARSTRTGAKSFRKVWRCRSCRKQFSVLVGTIFEGTKVPLRKWLMAIYLMCAGKNGVSALELQRDLGITYKSAWFVVHRIREAMAHSPGAPKLFGIVEADETWMGGDDKNRHSNKKRGPDDSGRVIVLSLVSTETGEVRSQVVPNVQGFTLSDAIENVADKAQTTLHTDGHGGYGFIDWEFKGHATVNHHQGEYARGDVTTNRVEGFFSQFKRSIDGTHHHISKEHVGRYAREFDFRYGTRRMSDGERATDVFRRADGAYLSYRRLISSGPVAQRSAPRPVGNPGPRRAGASLPRPA